MVGMVDAIEEELLTNYTQLLRHIYRPALESLLFFAEEGPERSRVYEEVLMSMQSLCSSLKGKFIYHNKYIFNDTKKRAELMRNPETVSRAEKIALDWLSMIERVLINLLFKL